jgi:HSP20 family protein
MNNTCQTPETAVAQPAAEARPARRPRYQIENSPEAHTVRVDLPGVAKDAVTLKLEEGILQIRARRSRMGSETWKPLHRELSDADYELRLKLDERVDEARVTARLEDGVLTLELPVKDAAKPRTIAIQ